MRKLPKHAPTRKKQLLARKGGGFNLGTREIFTFFNDIYLLLGKRERVCRKRRSGPRRRRGCGGGGRRRRGRRVAARWGGGSARRWPWRGTWRWERRWRRNRRRRRWRSCRSWSNARLCGRPEAHRLVATHWWWCGLRPALLLQLKLCLVPLCLCCCHFFVACEREWSLLRLKSVTLLSNWRG